MGGPIPAVGQPAKKKAKTDEKQGHAEDNDKDDDLSELCWKAWGLFSSYLEDGDDDDNTDTDDDKPTNDKPTDDQDEDLLEEICTLLQTQKSLEIKPFPQGKSISSIQTVADMLPILLSVIYCKQAEHSLGMYYHEKDADSSSNNIDKANKLLETSQEHIRQSLRYFPTNALTLSVAANLKRVTTTLNEDQKVDCYGYPWAATSAQKIRRETLAFLEMTTKEDSSSTTVMEYNPVEEWMEVLVLNQIVGVEYTVDDDDDEDKSNGDEATKDAEENEKTSADEKDEQDQGYFSASSVEATARYMTAILFSRMGCHDDALEQLQEFPGLSHRLHPSVWNNKIKEMDPAKQPVLTTSQILSSKMVPVSFGGENGVLPPNLYQRMCEVFKPGAAFWEECDYANRGYFSFLSNIHEDSRVDADRRPSNLIDDIVLNHLLPLVKDELRKNEKDNAKVNEICAYEWWVHSRSNQANLGHMLHFDTDEADLEGKKEVHHPLVSSVLHLTGDGSSSGTTIILDQAPQSKDVAPVCWRSIPQDNTYMIFPGDLLHGVLPCPGRASISSSDSDPYRLTFMIGWKTRQVPDQRKANDSLYGPCAPLPSQNIASWVKEIHAGYANVTSEWKKEPPPVGIRTEALPSVSPAWERIIHSNTESDTGPPLQLPSSLDRRFFVSGAPQCFLESLFEDDDT